MLIAAVHTRTTGSADTGHALISRFNCFKKSAIPRNLLQKNNLKVFNLRAKRGGLHVFLLLARSGIWRRLRWAGVEYPGDITAGLAR